jgi:hypothetical protein
VGCAKAEVYRTNKFPNMMGVPGLWFRDLGLRSLLTSRGAPSITVTYNSYFYPEVRCIEPDKFPDVLPRTDPGLEPRETRGTRFFITPAYHEAKEPT